MSNNGTRSRVRRAVITGGKLSSEPMSAKAEFGSEISQPSDLDWTRHCDSPIPDDKGVSGALLLEAVGGRAVKNRRLSAAADLNRDLNNMLPPDNLIRRNLYNRQYTDDPWVPLDLVMRTNDPPDRDPRFYVRRREASKQSSTMRLEADVVKMAVCIDFVELGNIGPPENHPMAKYLKVILAAVVLVAAVIVLVTLDLSKLGMSSETVYAVLLLLVALWVALPRLQRLLFM